MDARQTLGQKGESMVVAQLEAQGWKIITRNFRRLKVEIDIIAIDNDYNELVFIEVKTRKRLHKDTPPEISVTPNKIKNLTKCAEAFLAEFPQFDMPVRFDVFALTLLPNLEIKHWQDAFRPDYTLKT